MAFLIHYGWRGTDAEYRAILREVAFLIHYGWRGTRMRRSSKRWQDLVSNPLRLEGDPERPVPVVRLPEVSNPLRLEGDMHNLDQSGVITGSF